MRCTSLKLAGCVLASFLTGVALSGTSTAAQLQQLAQDAQSDVIVVLRDQLSNVPPMRRAMGARAAAIAVAQSPVLNQLRSGPARKVHSFGTINAFSIRVSAAERDTLASHPMVLAVVPDLPVRATRRGEQNLDVTGVSTAAKRKSNSGATVTDPTLCNTLEPEALQLTNTAFLNPATPQAQEVRDGNGEKVTGRGVKVAFIADGMDPTIAGFIRPDGSPVFVDYQDFTGDPAGPPTLPTAPITGAEAFGDASSIAAQDMPKGTPLLFDISTAVDPSHPLPSPCNIRIRGMAPGASLVGLKVISSLGSPTTTSTFVQAIEYAVMNDDVDVINESFRSNPYYDDATDPVSLANAAAVRAGVTVVVMTGDAGTNGTLGSPATDKEVIAAGGTTSFRLYAQTGSGAQALAHGDLSNNISALSSGGFAQLTPRTVDVVAPADKGWALCANPVLQSGLILLCNGLPIQAFGGTNESAPFIAGEAALVIQAYRSAHHGVDPTPDLVKRIIMSTAIDLGAPSSEQGAGLINSLAAVNMALSVEDANGRPKPRGEGLLANPTSVRITGKPDRREQRFFSITNTGTVTQHLAPTLETLGPPIVGATLNIDLDPNKLPTFLDSTGVQRPYLERKITIPTNAQHLDASIAWQTPRDPFAAAPSVYLGLLDPSGRQAAYSLPLECCFGSGYAHVDVVKPTRGVWTILIWTLTPVATRAYTGPVQLTWAAERYVKLGSVTPAHLHLAPGATEFVRAEFTAPSHPGDLAAAIRFEQSSEAKSDPQPAIPVTVRTLIPTGPTGGRFTGTLTGGNATRGDAGPAQTWAFDVPFGVKNMSLLLEVPDPGYSFEGLLVDPHGMQLSVQPNVDAFGNPQAALQLSRFEPEPGRWHFVLLDALTSGNQTTIDFSARIGFNTAAITADLPNDASTPISVSGAPATVSVNVTNTGALAQAYFADARLATYSLTELPFQICFPGRFLSPNTSCFWYVPTETRTVAFTAQSTMPINMDAVLDVASAGQAFLLHPDIYAKQVAANTAVAQLTEPEIPYGSWSASPTLIGPYGPAGAPSAPLTITASALMQPFDTTMAADTGDFWADLTLGTHTFNPLILRPGQSGVIKLTITPNASDVGRTVTGAVYVDSGQFTSTDEVVRIPYRYTVVQ